ncbi:hypothetical protein [Spirosoma arcticum]
MEPPASASTNNKKGSFLNKVFQLFKTASGLALFLLGTFSGVTGFTIFDYLTPKVEFEQVNSISRTRPFESIFELRNLSYFPIKDVTIDCLIDTMSMSQGGHIANATIKSIFIDVERLGSEQTKSMIYDLMIKPVKGEMTYGKMAFLLKYKFLNVSRKQVIFYECILNEDKTIIWAKDAEQDYVKTYWVYHYDTEPPINGSQLKPEEIPK